LRSLGWIVAAGLALAWAVWLVRRAWWRWRQRVRLRRALRGETAAEAVLARAGFRIDAVQPEQTWTIGVDGVPHDVALRADLLVSRGGRRYVAEVKTGDRAPSVTTAATRRQLLEYAIAYDADGVLLVDMEARRVVEVSFPRA
jgi:hypothetical protein